MYHTWLWGLWGQKSHKKFTVSRVTPALQQCDGHVGLTKSYYILHFIFHTGKTAKHSLLDFGASVHWAVWRSWPFGHFYWKHSESCLVFWVDSDHKNTALEEKRCSNVFCSEREAVRPLTHSWMDAAVHWSETPAACPCYSRAQSGDKEFSDWALWRLSPEGHLSSECGQSAWRSAETHISGVESVCFWAEGNDVVNI